MLKIYNVAYYDGALYILMEHVKCGCLFSLVNQVGRISETSARYILLVVAYAIYDLSHKYGYIHGDIKPENLLLTEDGRVIISDYNCAQRHDGDGTFVSYGFFGTHGFAAPEVGMDDSRLLDYKIDLFSLGATVGLTGGYDQDTLMKDRIPMDYDSDCWSEAGYELLGSLFYWTPEGRPSLQQIMESAWMRPLLSDPHAIEALKANRLPPPSDLVNMVRQAMASRGGGSADAMTLDGGSTDAVASGVGVGSTDGAGASGVYGVVEDLSCFLDDAGEGEERDDFDYQALEAFLTCEEALRPSEVTGNDSDYAKKEELQQSGDGGSHQLTFTGGIWAGSGGGAGGEARAW